MTKIIGVSLVLIYLCILCFCLGRISVKWHGEAKKTDPEQQHDLRNE